MAAFFTTYLRILPDIAKIYATAQNSQLINSIFRFFHFKNKNQKDHFLSTRNKQTDIKSNFANYKLNMTYYTKIKELTKTVPATLVDFELPRDPARTPTQASSNFITNKEQGDWAENLVFRAINDTSKNFVAVKYGKSDDLVAGEDGFDAFYQEFQDELDTIGKRPDILIFRKEDFINDWGG
ncbi:MAG: AccI family restriction endonuclease [Bacteroidales bacterium]|nr:AccI family restriction endonuclease [Bacteroidales bacterium]